MNTQIAIELEGYHDLDPDMYKRLDEAATAMGAAPPVSWYAMYHPGQDRTRFVGFKEE